MNALSLLNDTSRYLGRSNFTKFNIAIVIIALDIVWVLYFVLISSPEPKAHR